MSNKSNIMVIWYPRRNECWQKDYSCLLFSYVSEPNPRFIDDENGVSVLITKNHKANATRMIWREVRIIYTINLPVSCWKGATRRTWNKDTRWLYDNNLTFCYTHPINFLQTRIPLISIIRVTLRRRRKDNPMYWVKTFLLTCSTYWCTHLIWDFKDAK